MGFPQYFLMNLSEGKKRKINIASFILSSANLYLLDEPFNNLDKKTSLLLEEVFETKINTGSKIIFSSHDRSDDKFSLIDSLSSARALTDA